MLTTLPCLACPTVHRSQLVTASCSRVAAVAACGMSFALLPWCFSLTIGQESGDLNVVRAKIAGCGPIRRQLLLPPQFSSASLLLFPPHSSDCSCLSHPGLLPLLLAPLLSLKWLGRQNVSINSQNSAVHNAYCTSLHSSSTPESRQLSLKAVVQLRPALCQARSRPAVQVSVSGGGSVCHLRCSASALCPPASLLCTCARLPLYMFVCVSVSACLCMCVYVCVCMSVCVLARFCVVACAREVEIRPPLHGSRCRQLTLKVADEALAVIGS